VNGLACGASSRALTGAVGLIRNPAHVADIQRAGAEAVVCDQEAATAEDVAVLLPGAAAVAFAAGGGAGSGAPRKDSVTGVPRS
jgi:hypothetical protein